MLRSGRDYYCRAILIKASPFKIAFPIALLDADELIDIVMGLHTNFLTRRKRHDDQLAMRTRKRDLANVCFVTFFLRYWSDTRP